MGGLDFKEFTQQIGIYRRPNTRTFMELLLECDLYL